MDDGRRTTGTLHFYSLRDSRKQTADQSENTELEQGLSAIEDAMGVGTSESTGGDIEMTEDGEDLEIRFTVSLSSSMVSFRIWES